MPIPYKLLLPPLSPNERAQFDALCAEYKAAKALISSYSNDARLARKKALRTMLSTAPANKLLAIGSELETLDQSFLQAKRGSKLRLKELRPKYRALFYRLLDHCQSHANELIANAKSDWPRHFAKYGLEPVGESPVVAMLVEHKQTLTRWREHLDGEGQVIAPTSILPYAEREANG